MRGSGSASQASIVALRSARSGSPGQPISKMSVSTRVGRRGLDDAPLVDIVSAGLHARRRGASRAARPSAPRASAATRPRPSAMPPAASTGSRRQRRRPAGRARTWGRSPCGRRSPSPARSPRPTPAAAAAAASAGVSQRWKTFAPVACASSTTTAGSPKPVASTSIPVVEDRLDVLERLDLEDHVHADRAAVSARISAHPLDDLIGAVAGGAGHAEPAGVRDRRGELRRWRSSRCPRRRSAARSRAYRRCGVRNRTCRLAYGA